MSLRVGMAQTDITPLLGATMAGYSSRTHGATGVADPLYAQALVLSDGEQSAAIVSLDVCSFSLETKQQMKQAAAERTGLPPSSIVVCATHTHFGPVVDSSPWLSEELAAGVLPEYRANLVASVAGLVADAQRRLQPARLLAGRAEAAGISFNRRPLTREGLCANRLRLPPDQAAIASAMGCELRRQWVWGGHCGPRHSPPERRVEGLRLGVADPEVLVLRAEAEDGTPLAAVVSFACHPVCSGPDFYAFSADYPGVAREVLARELGVGSLFLLGAAGDQVPSWRDDDARQRVGQSLGGVALSAWHQATELGGPLRVAGLVADLPLRGFAPVQELRARLEALPDPSAPEAWRDRYELEMAEAFGGRTVLAHEVTAISVGNWALVTGPCEIVVEVGLRIKQGSPARATMLVSLAGENLSYMPTDEDVRAGGYEATTTALGPGASAVFVDAALAALRAVVRDE